MELRRAERLAREQMVKHGLSPIIWDFQWDNSKKRFGVCKYYRRCSIVTRGIIGLSKELVSLNDEATVMDVILHEIAHGLTPGHGHDWVWKNKCIEIGAKPERCYDSNEVDTPQMRYQAECGACGQVYQKTRITRVSLGRKSSCKCQSGIDWSRRVLLTYIDTKR